MEQAKKREFKNELFEQFARIGKALSSGRRLELLDLLAQGERPVEELAAETDMSVANASQHLQVLRSAHLVEVRRDGLYAYYRLSNDSVLQLWLSLRSVGEAQNAEISRVVDRFLKHRSGLQAITSEELAQRVKDSTVVVLDVRPEREYSSGHIRGARSIPIEELEGRLRELPRSKTIVAYCRGPYCVFADEAVHLLRSKRYKALRFQAGFPEWKMAGGPIAQGSPA